MLERELRRLRDELPADPTPVELILCPGDGGTPLGAGLERLAGELAAIGPFTVRTGSEPGPALTMSTGGGSISYRALPEGHEAAPFVDLLLALCGADGHEEGRNGARLRVGEPGADVVVFVADACPFCARAVRSALALAPANASTTIVDALANPDLAARHRVLSVPVTVIDDALRLTEVLSEAELAARIRARGTPEHEVDVLVSRIESGRIDEAVASVRREQTAFVTAWGTSTMTLRLGLMVVAEQLLVEEARSFDEVALVLARSLESTDAALRGDTADLLRKIGHPGAVTALRERRDDPNEDVAEAVRDALRILDPENERETT